MLQRPPPFTALRALEAACRHRSYTAAAAELKVTHSAVSQAVRRLEEEVGAKLFFRRGSAMEPATASLALAKAYAEAARSVGRAMRNISETSPNSVTISAPAEIARYWLSPLLSDLAAAFPDISLRVKIEGAGEPDVDIALRAAAPPIGKAMLVVAPITRGAYASPKLLQRHPAITPRDLLGTPLILEDDGANWDEWFAAAGVSNEEPPRGIHFDDDAGLAMDAAIRGLGVALCDELSVSGSLARGELVPVCPRISIDRAPLCASWAPTSSKSAFLGKVAHWLVDAACGYGGVADIGRPKAVIEPWVRASA